MNIHILLTIVIAAWCVGMATSLAALALALACPRRRFALSASVAAFAVVIGWLGVGRWTPVPSFPQIGYTWCSDTFEISLKSSWFFVGPLLLGSVALLLTIVDRIRHLP